MNALLRPLKRLMIVELLLIVGLLIMLMHCAEYVVSTVTSTLSCVTARLFPPAPGLGKPVLKKAAITADTSQG